MQDELKNRIRNSKNPRSDEEIRTRVLFCASEKR